MTRKKPSVSGKTVLRPSSSVEVANSLRRSTYSTTITVLVGVAKESFTVHEDIICARSNLFKAAVSKDWKEAGSKTVNLPEQSPAVFKAYLESVYFPIANLLELVEAHADELVPEHQDHFKDKESVIKAKNGHALIKLYVLGSFLGDTLFKNETIKAMVEGWNDGSLNFQVSDMVFDAAQAGCGLQKLMGDVLAKKVLTPGRVDEMVDALVHSTSLTGVSATLKAIVAKRYGDKWAEKFDAENYIER